MKKKLVCALLIMAVLAAFIPFTAQANAQIPAFTHFEATETTVEAGEEITFSISTLTAVTHVFTEVDGTRVHATERTRPAPATGTRNWTLTITPEESQTITVYANTSNRTEGAAAISIPVITEGEITGEVTINSVRTSGNNIVQGDAITFTVLTSNAVEYVFTEVDGRWPRATLADTNTRTGEKTWQLVVTPQTSQTLTIYANSSFVRDENAISNRQVIEVRQPTPLFEASPIFESGGVWRRHNWQNVYFRPQLQNENMLGVLYSNTLQFNILGDVGWTHQNLDRQINTITGLIGRIDGSGSGGSRITFIGDGRTLATFRVDGSTTPTPISVDVRGVQVLRIEFDQPSGGAQIAFANAMAR
ncbi:MAG: hypothetical protein FWC16_14390 [Defluviitaleaceae bacterium]|nr:hypothetical protein [Defluviitaleaceae bacterium]MCL2276103.1 hypothetical protein [Defluviitaleaceae bacterium]